MENLNPMPDENMDRTLVEQVKAGNDRAFDMLMERYKRPVLNFLYRMIGDASAAEDIAQEAFVRAYRGMLRPTFRLTKAEFSTWLFQIARNAALDYIRRKRRRPAASFDAMEADGANFTGNIRSAAENTMAKEAGELVAAAIALLPEEQRTAIVLSEYEGLPDARIADIMKCSQKSVGARLYRARRFLRERLAHLFA